MSDLGKTKAALAYLMDQLVYSDSYGVHGSDFAACRLCNGGGAPGVPLVHEKSCPIACYGDVAQEWWDEREEERKEAADEIERLSKLFIAASSTIELLESNARVQAKLLADTGRERDELKDILKKVTNALNEVYYDHFEFEDLAEELRSLLEVKEI